MAGECAGSSRGSATAEPRSAPSRTPLSALLRARVLLAGADLPAVLLQGTAALAEDVGTGVGPAPTCHHPASTWLSRGWCCGEQKGAAPPAPAQLCAVASQDWFPLKTGRCENREQPELGINVPGRARLAAAQGLGSRARRGALPGSGMEAKAAPRRGHGPWPGWEHRRTFWGQPGPPSVRMCEGERLCEQAVKQGGHPATAFGVSFPCSQSPPWPGLHTLPAQSWAPNRPAQAAAQRL